MQLDGVAGQHSKVCLVDDMFLWQPTFFPTESAYSSIFQMSLGQRADMFIICYHNKQDEWGWEYDIKAWLFQAAQGSDVIVTTLT